MSNLIILIVLLATLLNVGTVLNLLILTSRMQEGNNLDMITIDIEGIPTVTSSLIGDNNRRNRRLEEDISA